MPTVELVRRVYRADWIVTSGSHIPTIWAKAEAGVTLDLYPTGIPETFYPPTVPSRRREEGTEELWAACALIRTFHLHKM